MAWRQILLSRWTVAHANMVDNQTIVIPETIDAIGALSGTVRAASESIARTNAALGIKTSLT